LSTITRRPIDERLDSRSFGKDGFDQGAQLGNVPLSVAELIELPADRILSRDCEYLAKGTVRKPNRQVGLQHEQAFTDRLDQIQRVDFAHGQLSAADEGWLILDRRTQSPVSLPPVLIVS
jgi:hypothetical protein